MWTLLTTVFIYNLLRCSAIDVSISTPWDRVEGDKTVIPCVVDSQKKGVTPSVTFIKNLPLSTLILKNSTDKRITVTEKQNGSVTTATLTFRNMILSDEASDGYICQGNAGGEQKQSTFVVYVLPKKAQQNVRFVNTTDAEKGKPWTLICEATALKEGKIKTIDLSVNWYFSQEKGKIGNKLNNNSELHIETTKSPITGGGKISSKLMIHSIGAENGGYYTCRVLLKLPNLASHRVSKTASILIGMSREMGATEKIKVMKGKDAVLTCKVYGFPAGEVIWTRDGTVIDEMSNSRVSRSSYSGVKNAVLKIADTMFTDRGMYLCNATNGATSTTVEFTLRVKDPLGPLWPFVGIIIEAILLVIIIVISEKFRAAAKSKAASKAPANPESATLLEGKEATIA